MTRLILTTSDSGSGYLKQTGIADAVLPFGHRFTGPLPSEAEIADSLMAPSSQHERCDDGRLWRLYRKYVRERDDPAALADLCDQFDMVDLWIDPDPNAQLILIWLLDYFRPHEAVVSKMTLVQPYVPIYDLGSEDLALRPISPIKMSNRDIELGGLAWLAYRAPTPQAWFELLSADLSALPRLRLAVTGLLEELPMPASGLGATEMRMLELISEGNATPYDVFPGHEKANKRRVFGYWQVGDLLDNLAHCPVPLVSGLDEGPFTLEMHEDRDRHQRYRQSRLALTALGRAVLAGRDDFSRHNPIHRWWGGTELTNDRLWRWDAANQVLIEP